MQTIFFNKIFTGDETWCFAYDPETKRQISEWFGETSPRPKKLKFSRSLNKTMLIIFFRLSRRSAKRNSYRREKTVNAEIYKAVMGRLLKRIQRFRQLRSALEISCCTIMRPPTKLQVFASF